MPINSQTDLFVQHALKIGSNRQIQLQLNVLNLFNQRTAINRADSVGPRRDPNAPGFYQESAFYASQLNFDQLIAASEAGGQLWRIHGSS